MTDTLLNGFRSSFSKRKIFCIGRKKAGATPLKVALRSLGFPVGKRAKAEARIEDWVMRDFGRIIRYCRSATVFQDISFSLPSTYKALYAVFPDSKFILSVRSSPEEWHHTLLRFDSKVIDIGG